MIDRCSSPDCCQSSPPSGGSAGAGAGERDQAVALTHLPIGKMATVVRTSLDPGDAALLRAMGLRPASRVRLCRVGEPCVVEIMVGSAACACSSRIGMARSLAAQVMVSG